MPTVNVKLAGDVNKSVNVADLTSGTVADLKKIFDPVVGIAAEDQRIVFKGRVLKDEETLAALNLTEGTTVHVVRRPGATSGAAPAPAPQAAPAAPAVGAPAPTPAVQQQQQQQPANPFASLFGGGAGAPAGGGQHHQAPMGGFGGPMGGFGGGMGGGGFGGDPAQALQMLQNDPNARAQMQVVFQMMASNPQAARQIIGASPAVQAMPPDQRENMISLLSNPIMLQTMMAQMGIGGGGGMMPPPPPAPPTGGGGGGGLDMDALMAAMGGGGGGGAGGFGGGMGMGMGGGALPPMPPAGFGLGGGMGAGGGLTPEIARQRYATQLQQLQMMGFPNEEANIRALTMAQGNVDFAVNFLLGSG